MTLFTFDKYWGLDWVILGGDNYICEYLGYSILADRKIFTRPSFSIYKRGVISEEHKLLSELDTDFIIMNLKSLKETGKLIK